MMAKSEDWERHLDVQSKSGQSIAAYCRERGLSKRALYKYRLKQKYDLVNMIWYRVTQRNNELPCTYQVILHIGALNEIVMDCLKRYNLSLKCGEIFTH